MISEKTWSSREIKYSPLDGGPAAWMVVMGSFLVQLSSSFVDKSFGIIMVHLRNVFPDASVSSLALISTLNLGSFYFFSPFVSALMNRGLTPRQILIGCGFLSCISCIASAFSKSVTMLYFMYGIVQGCTNGLGCMASTVSANQYFEERRALANAVLLSGNTLGGIVVPPVVDFMMSEISLFGTLVVFGGVFLHFVVAGFLSRPIEDNYPSIDRQIDRIHDEDEKRSLDDFGGKTGGKWEKLRSALRRVGLDLELIKDPVLLLFIIAMAVGSTSLIFTWVILPPFMVSRGLTPSEAAFVMSILFIVHLVANSLFGFILNLRAVAPHRPLVFVVVVLFAALLDATAPLLDSGAAYVAYAVVAGANCSLYITLRNVAFLDLVGRGDIPAAFSLNYLAMGVGSLATPTVCAAVIDRWGRFEAGFAFNAGAEALAAAALAAAVAAKRGWGTSGGEKRGEETPETEGEIGD